MCNTCKPEHKLDYNKPMVLEGTNRKARYLGEIYRGNSEYTSAFAIEDTSGIESVYNFKPDGTQNHGASRIVNEVTYKYTNLYLKDGKIIYTINRLASCGYDSCETAFEARIEDSRNLEYITTLKLPVYE